MTNISEERIPGQTIWVGVVAYDPKVVTIWEGMRRYFHEEARLPVEVVLFQNYEAQVMALLASPNDVRPQLSAISRIARWRSEAVTVATPRYCRFTFLSNRIWWKGVTTGRCALIATSASMVTRARVKSKSCAQFSTAGQMPERSAAHFGRRWTARA